MADFKITLLDGLQMLRFAWESVSPTAIANCFRKAGFVAEDTEPEEPGLEEVANQDLVGLNMGNTCTFEEYIECDEEVQCVPMPSTADIVETVIAEENEDEEDDQRGELHHVSYFKASHSFSLVQSYLLQSSQPPYSLLQKLEGEINKHHSASLVQRSINDYFTNPQ
jgi:hypothetical protein